MKKVLLCFSVIFFLNAVYAQEVVPLFDDMPAFQEKGVSISQRSTERKAMPALERGSSLPKKTGSSDVSQKGGDSHSPKLGRDAKPLTSIVLAPFPNWTVDLNDENVKTKTDKKFEERQLNEEDIIKRKNPLTMTEKSETYDEYLNRLIEEKSKQLKTKDGKPVNPFGQRYDVSVFQLSDIGFGMTPEEVEGVLSENGYKLTKIEKSIPLFKTSFYNDECRTKHKLAILKEVRECILSYAQDDDLHYIRSEVFTRASTRETIQVDYTSPATDNISFRIAYVGKGDNSLNTSRANMVKKLKRKNDFWNLVFNTYGLPDDSNKLLWGDPTTAYMVAAMYGSSYNAYITMESQVLQDKDYLAAKEEMEEMPNHTLFTFAGMPDEDE